MTQRVVVLGGGYAGVRFINTLVAQKVDGVQITLVDRNPYHTMLTECHLVAAGSKPAEAIQLPFDLLEGFDFVQASIEAIDPEKKVVKTTKGELTYDVLVVALGSVDNDFGISGVRQYAHSLRSTKDAEEIRNRVAQLPANATVAIAGGGLTGVELAAELAHHYGSKLNFFILEAAPTILPGQPDDLRNWTRQRLGELGVNCLLGSPITLVDEKLIHLKNGTAVAYDLMVWSGGVKANPLVAQLGVATDRGGRAIVDKHLRTTLDNVYVLGDCASTGTPPTAQVSSQHGYLAAIDLVKRLKTGKSDAEFVFQNRGVLVDVGGSYAVGRVFDKANLSGRLPKLIKVYTEMEWTFKAGGLKALAHRLRQEKRKAVEYSQAGD
jgi:NADH dehydrogenase